jgi:hypothetical protein
MRFIAFFFFLFVSASAGAQEVNKPDLDSLKREILRIDQEIDHIQLNLGKTQKRFKLGILTATIGYSIVIAGGQMLGRENDEIGQALLYVGGGIGVGGTILLVDSYRFMKRAATPLRRKNK